MERYPQVHGSEDLILLRWQYSPNVTRTTGSLKAKELMWTPTSHHVQKLIQKWITDLNAKAKTVKLFRREHTCKNGGKKDKLYFIKVKHFWASLVAQWLGICLPVQGTRVRALVWEDPTCRGAAGPVSHNC